jgi:hypothetical protein
MEYVIVLLLIYLIFKDDIREEIRYRREKPAERTPEDEKLAKRKEQMEAELRNMMDYSVDTAVDSKRKQV